MATYAIGDIQGCYQSLLKLLNLINFDASQDQLWIAGDLINRGPQSLETLRFLYKYQNVVNCVLGNHDLHFLAIASGSNTPSKKDTLQPLLEAKDSNQLVNWLSKQPLFYYDSQLNFAMSHAGIPPMWSLAQAQNYSAEVSECLQSSRANSFYAAMYGNTPALWNEQASGMRRLRVITNYFTRMRYCFADGSLELTNKKPLGKQPQDLYPWFDLKRKPLGCDLVFGHWASLQGKCAKDGIYALDTGCVWGGQLTAMRLEDKKRFCVANAE